MKIFRESNSGNYIVSICIGLKYFTEWENYASPGWKAYVKRHDLGLIVFDDDLISSTSTYWKKATWQKMLIGFILADSRLEVNNVLYLDSDILISPLAPNIFDDYNSSCIAVVSQVKNLPQPLHLTLRRLAFLRHTHLSNNYPLDSALFMTIPDIFKYHSLPIKDDYFCAGMFVFNIANHSKLMESWFMKYTSDIITITGGGDEAHMNYEIQSFTKVEWLPYEFQALWIYECAWRYPFLFSYGINDNDLIRACIRSSLYVNHFLHFAGSWNECEMWKLDSIFSPSDLNEINDYQSYLKTPVTGGPVGIIKPS